MVLPDLNDLVDNLDRGVPTALALANLLGVAAPLGLGRKSVLAAGAPSRSLARCELWVCPDEVRGMLTMKSRTSSMAAELCSWILSWEFWSIFRQERDVL